MAVEDDDDNMWGIQVDLLSSHDFSERKLELELQILEAEGLKKWGDDRSDNPCLVFVLISDKLSIIIEPRIPIIVLCPKSDFFV